MKFIYLIGRRKTIAVAVTIIVVVAVVVDESCTYA